MYCLQDDSNKYIHCVSQLYTQNHEEKNKRKWQQVSQGLHPILRPCKCVRIHSEVMPSISPMKPSIVRSPYLPLFFTDDFPPELRSQLAIFLSITGQFALLPARQQYTLNDCEKFVSNVVYCSALSQGYLPTWFVYSLPVVGLICW